MTGVTLLFIAAGWVAVSTLIGLVLWAVCATSSAADELDERAREAGRVDLEALDRSLDLYIEQSDTPTFEWPER